MRHRVLPLLLIARDGFRSYVCLDCGRPASPQRRGWRHYQHAHWIPRKEAA